ncbi:hypothetical protein AYI69_g8939 [Smittium culicis]|uniref:Uncharacterized protein n=1 Tax=Smittium culicis TaxID=133412 RepID=A0A1R1XG65_9FUNG|nr:hypothetical protein AYI69_g8939 [Smittium culicis]
MRLLLSEIASNVSQNRLNNIRAIMKLPGRPKHQQEPNRVTQLRLKGIQKEVFYGISGSIGRHTPDSDTHGMLEILTLHLELQAVPVYGIFIWPITVSAGFHQGSKISSFEGTRTWNQSGFVLSRTPYHSRIQLEVQYSHIREPEQNHGTWIPDKH